MGRKYGSLEKMGGMMKGISITTTNMPDVKLIRREPSTDERGSNLKMYAYSDLQEMGIEFAPLETLIIRSRQGTLRGLHFQWGKAQSRLLTCLHGELFVAVAELNPNITIPAKVFTHIMATPEEGLYVPEGYALGTYALEDAEFICMCGGNGFAADCARGIRWDDEKLSIPWPLSGNRPLLSNGDKILPTYEDAMKYFGEK